MKANRQLSQIYDKLTILIHHKICFQRIEKRSGCTSHFNYLICNKILELFRTNLASRLIHHMLYLFVPKSWTNPNIKTNYCTYLVGPIYFFCYFELLFKASYFCYTICILIQKKQWLQSGNPTVVAA